MNLNELFSYNGKRITVPRGRAVFTACYRGNVMYVVMSGVVNIYVGQQVVERAEVGTLFGEMALISDEPRTATAIAVNDCELVAIDTLQFYSLVQQAPTFATKVMKVMADRLRRMNERMLDKASNDPA
jgi:CRP/FNR family transcriptional regulator, cyclic AMP receptor protein